MKDIKLIGVRFTSGGGIYTYKVPSKLKVYLGQELVVDDENRLPRVVWCVSLKQQVPEGHTLQSLKSIRGVVTDI